MLERELKLYIPGNSMAALKQRMATLNPQSHTLRATYYDTPDRALAHAKAALRVRLENDVWVQTLKMAGPDELSKIELNHNLSHQALELEKFKNGPAYPLIKSVARELQPRYQTCVARQTARVKVGESLVEIALDEGVIKAGNSELSISEIEFELISGPVDALFEIGEAWLTDFQLILELRSKSERGDALAKFCARESLDADMTPAEALARRPYRLNTMSLVHSVTMQDCYANSASAYLTQVIRNAAFLSGIDNIRASAGQQASYLALMRVGMRRLRSCRRLFRPWMTHSEKNLAKSYATIFPNLERHATTIFYCWRFSPN
ncbi:CYTH domain-containing protein [Paenalcaligenes niemegkensis]|uniref:CYTH domain-containing protein n=1 Tax=Paenalcaligenes niemegkensis TaxID=2895469 RepID=UPI0027E36608|nr:CYTH domain-containing protein [Paenalcaligenes niemegkensis]MCQ9615344.1 CYTH domain-containing protein [Paenalcaligenes niemegkensis]